MGTRNLIAVMRDGEYKVAQYGQWDGYPSGQGVRLLDFLASKNNVLALHKALDKVRFLEPEGKDKEFMDSYNTNTPEWSNDPDNRTPEQKAWFRSFASRDLGSEILKNIIESEGEALLINRISFAGDSLFCEYAYVIDLDKNTFEIYQGFNKEKISEGRFISGDPTLENENDYEPVKLIRSYDLNSLPSEESFLSDLEPDDEEDAA